VAFPSISTGAYGYPVAQAARVAVRAVRAALDTRPGALALVRFVLFSAADLATYQAAATDL
jgi:O-acetyl-ADP-ribose deacetylase (regulator of RNase III)